jgi:CubicO group peptidase (beta-lactamase class C family)
MSRWNTHVFVPALLIVLSSAALVFAVAPADRSDTSTSEIAGRITDYMQAINQLGPFSGVILVAKDNKVVASAGYGMADFEFQVRNTPQTRFRIASVTKSITATAVMLLADEGKLSVEDPIVKYLPKCPDGWKSITIRQLLTHTSGLSDYFDLAGYDEKKRAYTGGGNFIEKLGTLPLQSAPGKDYKYTNSNYILLGYIIEAASGKPYETFLRERIFGPLHMNSGLCVFDGGGSVPVCQGTGGRQAC